MSTHELNERSFESARAHLRDTVERTRKEIERTEQAIAGWEQSIRAAKAHLEKVGAANRAALGAYGWIKPAAEDGA